MARQPVVQLHEANGDKAVEPGVGRLIDEVLVGLLVAGSVDRPQSTDKVGTLAALVGRERTALDGIGSRGIVAVLADAEAARLQGHLGHELATRPDAEVLDGGVLHGGSFPSAR